MKPKKTRCENEGLYLSCENESGGNWIFDTLDEAREKKEELECDGMSCYIAKEYIDVEPESDEFDPSAIRSKTIEEVIKRVEYRFGGLMGASGETTEEAIMDLLYEILEE